MKHAYRILTELGQAGIADVFLGVSQGTTGVDELVVLKMLRSDLASRNELVALFKEDARLAARLAHPNLVQTRAVDVVAGRPAIVMDYTDGVSLSQITKTLSFDRDLRLRVGLRAMIDTLAALHCIHELFDDDGSPLGLVHRDLSPHNVFVTYDGTIKVLDFGFTHVASLESPARHGVTRGKLHYMAPEQMLDEALDRRADVFAAGVMLWELLTGERLWKSKNDVVVMHNLFSGSIRSPAMVNDALPEQLTAICMKALASEREERYATAAELQSDLEAFVASHDLAMPHRLLGEVVSAHFAQQRANLQAIIGQQFTRVEARLSPRTRRLGLLSAALGAVFLGVVAFAGVRARETAPVAFAATEVAAPPPLAPAVTVVLEPMVPAPSAPPEHAPPPRPAPKKRTKERATPCKSGFVVNAEGFHRVKAKCS